MSSHFHFGSSYNPSKSPNRYARKSFQAPDFDDYDDEEDADYEDEEMDEDAPAASAPASAPGPPIPSFKPAPSLRGSMLASSPPRGLKRSRSGEPRARGDAYSKAAKMVYEENKHELALHESDDIILQSEHILSGMFDMLVNQPSHGQHIFVEAAADLTKLWRQAAHVATKPASIGPQSGEDFTHANYLASLLLQLYYPHTYAPQKAPTRPSRAVVPAAQAQLSIPVPQALLNWLNTYHNPFPDDFDDIHLNQPSPSAHESFWDVLYAALLRGKLDRVIRLLKDAGWDNAYTAVDDQAPNGYTDQELDNIEEVVAQCIHVLDECPGYRYKDWDTRTMEWTVFRQRVRTTLDELEEFCESDDMGQSLNRSNVFQQSLGNSLNLSTASRRASSKVPWTVYQNLKLLYGMVLGEPDDILMTAQDWLEGAMYLTVWWDGTDDGLDASVTKSCARRSRELDVAPVQAYRRRLADAFARAQEVPPEVDERGGSLSNVFVPDITDHTQVGLACILEDNVGGALFILRRYSFPVSVSVVEIAAADRWLPTVRPSSRGGLIDQGLNKEDLLVLSSGPNSTLPTDQDRDEILQQFAELLFEKPQVNLHSARSS